MDNPKVSNPNDFKVVSFTNKTDFTFTPDMGCMYDGRPISGITGAPGINGGESMTLPYHIGHRLATNLAKVVKLRRAPTTDEANNPVGKPLWSDEDLEALKNSFLTDLYSEQKPLAVSETDRLFQQVEEYKRMVEKLIPSVMVQPAVVPVAEPTPTQPETVVAPAIPNVPVTFADKQDVIAELEKRGVKHDKRSNKAALETLLT